MNGWLLFGKLLIALAAVVYIGVVTKVILERLVDWFAQRAATSVLERRRRLEALRLRPCTVHWQPGIVFAVGSGPLYGALALSLVGWASREHSCQSLRSGSPLH